MVTLQEVRNAISREHPDIPSQAYEENGIIYVHIDDRRKLFVPESLRPHLMETAHKSFGHLGVKATHQIVDLKYHWPGMRTDLQHYIEGCDTCARCKNYGQIRRGELLHMPETPNPMQLLAMDTISGFKDYGSIKTHLTLVIDYATRYVWTFASKTITQDQSVN